MGVARRGNEVCAFSCVGSPEDTALWACPFPSTRSLPIPLPLPPLPPSFPPHPSPSPSPSLSQSSPTSSLPHAPPSFKPKQLGRNKELVRQVVTALCAMAAQPPPPDLDPEDDGVLPPSKMATQVGGRRVERGRVGGREGGGVGDVGGFGGCWGVCEGVWGLMHSVSHIPTHTHSHSSHRIVCVRTRVFSSLRVPFTSMSSP